MTTYKLLETDAVHLIHPKLVECFGRLKAEFLSQVHYWSQTNAGSVHEGKRWIYNTYKQWAEQFKISERHMKRVIADLVAQKIIVTQKLSSHKSNRTNYYALDYDTLNILFSDKMSLSKGQNVPMVIQENTNKEENNKSNKVLNVQVEQVVNFENKKKFKEVQKEGSNKTVQNMVSYWNKTFPKAQTKLSKDMARTLMGAYIHRFEKNTEKWEHYCTTLTSSSYLMGEEFILTLSWALKFSTIDRILKGELGVKLKSFRPSENTFKEKAEEHIKTIGEGDRCQKTRYDILQKIGASAYISWFTQVKFEEQEGRVYFKANNQFTYDYIMQKFGTYLTTA